MLSTHAVVAHRAGDLRYDLIPLLEPAANEAVVRIHYGGICGSDLHYWKHGQVGESVLREPMVLGHEVVGVVDRPAADGSGPALGAEVFVHPATVCGVCDFCRSGRANLCLDLRYLGSAARRPHTEGAFADRVIVPTSRLLSTTGVAARDAALIEPTAVAWHATTRVEDVGRALSGRIAVVGCGPIGLLTVAVLRSRAPLADVIAVDLFERALDVARSLGAVEAMSAEVAATELANNSTSVVFETSGTAAGFNLALRSVAPGGTVVAVGQLPPEIATAAQLIIGRELVVVGSSRFFDAAGAVIQAMQAGKLHVRGVVTHVADPRDPVSAFAMAADSARSSKVLLDFSLIAGQQDSEPR